jgi:LAO/AO transport system kinase
MSLINTGFKITKKDLPDAETLHQSIIDGNRFELGRAITLVESKNKEEREVGKELLKLCLQSEKDCIRIGISGPPGAGKSTLLESLGKYLIKIGLKPAVLTIDPSSGINKGSILGDKTRMPLLAGSENAFVRSSPSGDNLGGVAQNTREIIPIIEAAGFNPVFIETVGVGQSETEVASMTDLFILLLQPGAGDELQGIKKGIMELADIIIINKNDNENKESARKSFAQYSGALNYIREKENGWSRKVILTSAMENSGIMELWDEISRYFDETLKNGFIVKNREIQGIEWFKSTITNSLISLTEKDNKISSLIKDLNNKLTNKSLSPIEACDLFIEKLEKLVK